MGFSISNALGSAFKFALAANPITGPAVAAVDLLKSVVGGGNSTSSFSAGTVAAGAGAAVLGNILSPQSVFGQELRGVAARAFPGLNTAKVSDMLNKSSFASSISNAFGGGNANSLIGEISRNAGTSEASVEANIPAGMRDMMAQLKKDDPVKYRGMLLQMIMENLKWMNELVSNMSKTRAEMGMTTARNLR